MKTWLVRMMIVGVLASALFGGSLAFAQAMDSHEEMSHGATSACVVHCLTAALNDADPSALVQMMPLVVMAAAVIMTVALLPQLASFVVQPVRARPRSVGMVTVIKRE